MPVGLADGAFDPDALVFAEDGAPFNDRDARNRARNTWTQAKLTRFCSTKLGIPPRP
jgi:hypothetical protein